VDVQADIQVDVQADIQVDVQADIQADSSAREPLRSKLVEIVNAILQLSVINSCVLSINKLTTTTTSTFANVRISLSIEHFKMIIGIRNTLYVRSLTPGRVDLSGS